jgi:hypothetical protein
MTERRRAQKRASSANGGDPAAVLLEEVRSQMKVVIEAVQGCAQKGDVDAGPTAQRWTLSNVASRCSSIEHLRDGRLLVARRPMRRPCAALEAESTG